jgi:hypothetical protein
MNANMETPSYEGPGRRSGHGHRIAAGVNVRLFLLLASSPTVTVFLFLPSAGLLLLEKEPSKALRPSSFSVTAAV